MQDEITDVRTFERFLRENGFSRTRAKAIATKGFRLGGMEASCAEVADAVRGLQAGARRLKALADPDFCTGCGPDCTDCSGCRKSSGDEWDCTLRLNDVRHSNEVRWRTWKERHDALMAYDAKAREFSEKYDLKILRNLVVTAFELLIVEADPLDPGAVTQAGMSVVQFLRTLGNYNGERARQFQDFIFDAALRVRETNDNWKFQEKAFWEVVQAYRERGCERTHMPLAPSDFNQPPQYRF